MEELSQHWPPHATDKASSPFLPSEEQLQRLVYLEATIRETMRLYPVVAFNIRTCVTDTLLSDGTFVTAGTRIGLSTFAMGRMEKLWGNDAHEFKPERWLEGDGDALRIKHVPTFRFPVFHTGPRVCLERHLAMLEMKVTATLLTSFQLVVWPKNHQAKYVASLIHPMQEPLYVRSLPRVAKKEQYRRE